MFDFSFGELAITGLVALVVLGPERLPKVARTVGEWAGKAQRYVSQVKSDINRELEISELKKLQEQARDAARAMESSMQSAVSGVQGDLQKTADALNAAGSTATAAPGSADPLADPAWDSGGESWRNYRFDKRYKPGPSIDELAEELVRLRRQLALHDTSRTHRGKYAPRARLNRPRIRR